jgi:hypothetical protein
LSEPWKSYEIIFGEGALAGLYGEVPKSYFDCIYHALQDLARNPTDKAVRCETPYPGTRQFDFDCPQGPHGFVFRAHFFFEPGETRIRIFDVKATANW